MIWKLFLLFFLVPLAEMALLIWVGQYIGILMTVGLVMLTAAVGAAMARAQGMYVWYRVVRTLKRGEVPADELLEGVLILVAGVVFLTPGFLTDAAGLALLIPGLRRWVAGWIRDYVRELINRQGSVHINLGGPWNGPS